MAQPVLTVGEIRLHTRKNTTSWLVTAQPHVRIRLKNIFGGILKQERDELVVSHTDDNCQDLRWFMDRYPLVISDEDRAILDAGAKRHRSRTRSVLQILSGDFQLPASTMLLPARAYQAQAAAIVLRIRNLLLVDELGLGKTVSAIRVMADPKTLPALCVVPAPLTHQWVDQIRKFLPSLRTHVLETSKPYDLRDKDGNEPHVLITSYTRLSGWEDHLAGKIRLLVFDEVQELRTGHIEQNASKKNVAAKRLSMTADYRLGLSGTPIYNYGGELWNILDILAPGTLGEQYEFQREWCVGRGRKTEVCDPKALGSFLRSTGTMLRRTRDDVGRELPPVSTVIHEVSCVESNTFMETKTAAAELARLVLDTSRKALERGHAGRQLDAMLRQATGVEKAPQVAAFVRMMLEQQSDKVVLFGWHREVYRVWAELLHDLGVVWYTGSESVVDKRAQTKIFLEGNARVLLMSLRAGLGLDGLQEACATAVFGELDWTHGVHEQCIGRLHRDGQKHPVFAYYVISDSGSDPVICDALGLKASQLEGIRDPHGAPLTTRAVDSSHIKRLAEDYLRRIGET